LIDGIFIRGDGGDELPSSWIEEKLFLLEFYLLLEFF